MNYLEKIIAKITAWGEGGVRIGLRFYLSRINTKNIKIMIAMTWPTELEMVGIRKKKNDLVIFEDFFKLGIFSIFNTHGERKENRRKKTSTP